MTYYDIMLMVTPRLLETNPEYSGVDLVVLATAYDEITANFILKFMEIVANDGSELFVRTRTDGGEASEKSSLVIGVFTNDQSPTITE